MIVEMTERISKVETPGNLPATVVDINKMYKFFTLNLGISVDDITVLATEADCEKIIYQVPEHFDKKEKDVSYYPGPSE